MNTWSGLFESVWNDLREGVADVLNLVEEAVDSDPSVYKGDVGETGVSAEEYVDAQADHMTEEEYRRELWHWGRRVRRDILALETWAKSQDPSFKPGGPGTEDPADTASRIDKLKAEQDKQRTSGDNEADGTASDSGDPSGGPQDEL